MEELVTPEGGSVKELSRITCAHLSASGEDVAWGLGRAAPGAWGPRLTHGTHSETPHEGR